MDNRDTKSDKPTSKMRYGNKIKNGQKKIDTSISKDIDKTTSISKISKNGQMSSSISKKMTKQ